MHVLLEIIVVIVSVVSFGHGEPFVPPLFESRRLADEGASTLTARSRGHGAAVSHRSWKNTAYRIGQPMHCPKESTSKRIVIVPIAISA